MPEPEPFDVRTLPISAIVTVGKRHYFSGQLGLLEGKLVKGGIQAELKQIFLNIETLLKHHEAKMSAIFKTTVYLTDMNDFVVMNEAFREAFRDSPEWPTRTTVGVASLPLGAKVEIEVIAIAKPHEPSAAKLREKQAHDKGGKH
ncbi:MAG: RidA family protein [bacterium]|nr:RidA family protein [bacterium]